MFCKNWSLKRQLQIALGFGAVGCVCLAAALLMPQDSYLRGFLLGCGSALLAFGVIRTLMLRKKLRSPEEATEYEAQQRDERMSFIRSKSCAMTLFLSMGLEYAGGIAALIAGQRILGMVLCWVVVGQAVLRLVFEKYYQKKY
ncbi:MAG: hypothetical protein LKJ86_02560 [Oscillibacter sp.]|nr:hypothetical protein [Oscillibacter sp.]